MDKIGKTQLIDTVAEKTGMSKKQAADAYGHLVETLIGALRDGKAVGIPGLGTFSVAETKERQATKPGTGEKFTVPAGKKVRFKAASNLKEQL